MSVKKFRTTSSVLSTVVFILAVFIPTLFGSGVAYALNHSGNITSDETWSAADNPHIVTGSIHVYSGATLTIEKGCVVKFDAYTALSIGYFSAGALIAEGTEDYPITFTSNTGAPAPGNWEGIVFYNSTDDASTIMDYCMVEYGGYGTFNSNIYCSIASPTIQNCTIQYSDGYGIYCNDDSAPTLTNNTISKNGSFAISEFCDMLDSNVTGNTGSGNGTNAIEVRGTHSDTSESMQSSHTWFKQGLYFNVTSNIDVYSDATLTITPGCLVKFNKWTALSIGYYSNGALSAVGTSGNPIIFTSNESTPAPGDWEGIVFYNSTVDGSTIMDYCTVEFGGYDTFNSNIYCSIASPTIQNCTIQYSDGYGIYCNDDSAPTLTNNTISNNGSFAISEFCDMLDSNVTGNTGSGNGTNAIEVRGTHSDTSESMQSSHTWIKQDLYFNVTRNINVYSDATLTITPGCLVKFNKWTALSIGYYSNGALSAVGTSGNPIIFTSNESTPAPADWEGIVFYNSTDDASTIMDYCTVEYGGYDTFNSNIYCSIASPIIQNCTIQYSDGYGIYCNDDSAPTLTNNTISNNGTYPISEYCNMLDSNVTGNTGSGNGTDAIEVRSGNITSSHTWVPQDLYFNITGAVTHVYNDAILTINPGCLVKFDAYTALHIGYFSAATLIADGTSDKPITFTSNVPNPAPGNWQGIVFFNSTVDGSTIMDYCTVEFGGYGSPNSNINCNMASPTIQNCIIRKSDGYGIYTTGSGADPLISCSTITNNTHGVYVNSGNPAIADSNITGNTDFGVYNSNSSITIDAENNWWGDSSGPGGAGPGTGNAVSDYVDYDPWRTAFDSCLETIVLSPASGTNIVGSQHTVTAEVRDESDNPVEGIVVSFVITAGPHAGQNGTDATDANGQATFNYTGTLEGTDTIAAGFVDFHGRTRTSNSVTMTWGPVNNPPVAMCGNVTVSADANCSSHASVDNGSYDPDSGDTISVSQFPAGPYPLGETTVTLTVTDNHDASSTCQATVTVVDDTPPSITLNGDETMTVECHGNFTDPGATASDNCAGTVNVTTSGSVNTNMTGTYTITYSATDGTNTATKTRTVEVEDNTVPTITLKPTITYWSPDHKYKTVTVSQMVQGANDICDSVDISDVVIERVTSDEPDNIRGDSDGNTRNDIVIAATCKSVQLRSERDGLKNGRVYVITLRVTDNSGNEARAEFKVTVPLSQNQAPAIQDAVAYTVTSNCQ